MSELIDLLLADASERMDRSVESIRQKFGTVRTGRASPALLDRIMVDYYGAQTPLKQLATISSPEARLLTVQAYDKSSVKSIEKAIMESDVGLTPNSDGALIRLAIPELTEERRKELVKVVHSLAEEGRVAVRNTRRECMHELRELKGSGDVGSDDEHRGEVELQKLTDAKITELDALMKGKEAEVLEV
ncbi:MAG TPA: ribosome recycling factor [Solirubrobacteraceae bacterium]|jgi:ribosome recycling factor|nr:ribosome recycling factor [Solirubrobacteraceae bacterium]